MLLKRHIVNVVEDGVAAKCDLIEGGGKFVEA